METFGNLYFVIFLDWKFSHPADLVEVHGENLEH
jgi:hypothetical protein